MIERDGPCLWHAKWPEEKVGDQTGRSIDPMAVARIDVRQVPLACTSGAF